MTTTFRPERHTVRFVHSILRSTFNPKASTRWLLVCLALALLCSFVIRPTEARTSACECNRNAPDIVHARWLPRSTLRLMFARGDFSSAEISAFHEAIRLWQAVLPKSGTGIDLQSGGEIAGNNCTGCIIVKRKREMPGTFASLSMLASAGGFYSKAVINIKSDVHQTGLLRMLLTHELGHAFGLDDCVDCGRNTTVMNSVNKYAFGAFSFFAPRNKMASAPTECDVARVSAGYAGASEQLARNARTSSAAAVSPQFIKAVDRAAYRAIPAQAINATATTASARHHASRAVGQSQRSFKIEQLALMDALARRN